MNLDSSSADESVDEVLPALTVGGGDTLGGTSDGEAGGEGDGQDGSFYASAAEIDAAEAWGYDTLPADVPISGLGVFGASKEAVEIMSLRASDEPDAQEAAQARAKAMLLRMFAAFCGEPTRMTVEDVAFLPHYTVGAEEIPPGDVAAVEAQIQRVHSALATVNMAVTTTLDDAGARRVMERIIRVIERHATAVRAAHGAVVAGDPYFSGGGFGDGVDPLDGGEENNDHSIVIHFMQRVMSDNKLGVDANGNIFVSKRLCTKKAVWDATAREMKYVEKIYDTLVPTQLKRFNETPMTVESLLQSVAVRRATDMSTYNACCMDPRFYHDAEVQYTSLVVDFDLARTVADILFRESRQGKNDAPDGRPHAAGVTVLAVAVRRMRAQNLLPRAPVREPKTIALTFANGVYLAHATTDFCRRFLDGRRAPHFWDFDDPTLPRGALVSRVLVMTRPDGEPRVPVYLPFDEFLVYEALCILAGQIPHTIDYTKIRRASGAEVAAVREVADYLKKELHRAGAQFTASGMQELFSRSRDVRKRVFACIKNLPKRKGEQWLSHWLTLWNAQGINGQTPDKKDRLNWHVAWFTSQVVMAEVTKARALTVLRGASNAGKTSYLQALQLLVTPDFIRYIAVPEDPTFPLSEVVRDGDIDLFITEDASKTYHSGIKESAFFGIVDGKFTGFLRNMGSKTREDMTARWLLATNSVQYLDFIIVNSALAGWRRCVFEEFKLAMAVHNTSDVTRRQHEELGAWLLFGCAQYNLNYDKFTQQSLMDHGFEPDFMAELRRSFIRSCDPIARILSSTVIFHIDKSDPGCAMHFDDVVLTVMRAMRAGDRDHGRGDDDASSSSGPVGYEASLAQNVRLRLEKAFGLTVKHGDFSRVAGAAPTKCHYVPGIRKAQASDGFDNSSVVSFLRSAPFALHPMHSVVYEKGARVSVVEVEVAFAHWANFYGRPRQAMCTPELDVLEAVLDEANAGFGTRGEEDDDAAFAQQADLLADAYETPTEAYGEGYGVGEAAPEPASESESEGEGEGEHEDDLAARSPSPERSSWEIKRVLPPATGSVHLDADGEEFAVRDGDIARQVLGGPLREVAVPAPFGLARDEGRRVPVMENLRYVGAVGAYVQYVLAQALVHKASTPRGPPPLVHRRSNLSGAGVVSIIMQNEEEGIATPVPIVVAAGNRSPVYPMEPMLLEDFCCTATTYAQRLLAVFPPPPLSAAECTTCLSEVSAALDTINSVMGLGNAPDRLAVVAVEKKGYAIANVLYSEQAVKARSRSRKRRASARDTPSGSSTASRTPAGATSTPARPQTQRRPSKRRRVNE